MAILGEIKRGNEIGRYGGAGYAKYIYHACISCGKERWIRLINGQPVNLHCQPCSNKNGQHNISHTEEAKRKMSLARLGIPNPLNRQKFKDIDGTECFECSKCHQFLPKKAFYKEKRPYNSSAGIKSQCKTCHIETSIRTRDPENTRILRIKSEAKRRAIKAGSYIERISFETIKLRDRMICGLCGKKVKESELSFDHIIPLSLGGAHTEWNLQVAHRSCNSHKYMGIIPSQTRLKLSVL